MPRWNPRDQALNLEADGGAAAIPRPVRPCPEVI